MADVTGVFDGIKAHKDEILMEPGQHYASRALETIGKVYTTFEDDGYTVLTAPPRKRLYHVHPGHEDHSVDCVRQIKALNYRQIAELAYTWEAAKRFLGEVSAGDEIGYRDILKAMVREGPDDLFHKEIAIEKINNSENLIGDGEVVLFFMNIEEFMSGERDYTWSGFYPSVFEWLGYKWDAVCKEASEKKDVA